MASYFDDHDVTEDQIPTGGLDPQFVQMLERMNQINIGESNDEQGTRVPEWTSDLMLAWPDLLQNMAATSENPPASKEVLENLEEVTVEASPVKGGKLACPICTDEFDVKAVQLPCKHLFHRQCIVPWLEKKNTCPMCRHELPTDDPHYERRKKERERRAIAEDLYTNGMYT